MHTDKSHTTHKYIHKHTYTRTSTQTHIHTLSHTHAHTSTHTLTHMRTYTQDGKPERDPLYEYYGDDDVDDEEEKDLLEKWQPGACATRIHRLRYGHRLGCKCVCACVCVIVCVSHNLVCVSHNLMVLVLGANAYSAVINTGGTKYQVSHIIVHYEGWPEP